MIRGAALLFAAAALGCGAGDGAGGSSVDGAFTEGLPVPAVPDIEFATGFTVSSGPGYRVVHASPDPSALDEGAARLWADGVDRMVLVARGTRPRLPPELESAPRFEVPAASVTVNRDADALRVKLLGRLDRLRGIGGTGIYDLDIHRLVESGQLGAVGSALHRTTNTEFLLTEGIEAAFFRVASLDHARQYERLRDVGVPVAPMFAWAERSYLGRAEWIRYLGLFLGAEAEADRLFREMRARRDSLVARVAGASPVPATWAFRSGDRWMVHRNSLESELLRDAGAENVLGDASAGVTEGEGGLSEGVPMTDEEFLIAARRAQYWITWDRTDERWPSRAYLEQIPAYREGRVYHHRVRVRPEHGGDDWYEGAQVDPTSVLADLIALLHPTRLPGHRFEWIAPLERER
ncbi:MAG: ABC transporter substrate-binding protein [Gemmatimonadales bacterium]|nr:ABC transporter substrate-binding protein [Gemmatimonadota bacterium]MYG24028.1 ABC transporter substrate-binding protein [Gemmatimonadota bacterium]MYG48332.1 ABC transporter substrate-binding protein [Gemmatimonadales bacterium]MYJ39300.1 ABC transporter substrate-binding protein [Gemmatimonadota bacterium]